MLRLDILRNNWHSWIDYLRGDLEHTSKHGFESTDSGLDFDFQPVLRGELVEVRPLGLEDYNALYEAANDPLIWEQHPARNRHVPDEFRAFFNDAIQSGGALAVLKTGTKEIIGTTRFHGYDPDRS